MEAPGLVGDPPSNHVAGAKFACFPAWTMGETDRASN